jgi:hypothetical protein
MRISSSPNSLPVIPNENSLSGAAATASGHNIAEFTQGAELNHKLRALPDVRTDEVQRGKLLVEGPAHPPPYTILRLARLLAVELNIESESDKPSLP